MVMVRCLALCVTLTSAFRVATRPRLTTQLRGWGGEVSWGEAEVLSNEKCAEGLRAITISVPEAKAAAHVAGGQFVQIKQGEGKPGFFAIASPPGCASDKLEFLIKEAESNVWLTEATKGASVDMSDVTGKGFQTDTNFSVKGDASTEFDGFACTNILMFATGSGISPIRSCIESGLALPASTPATLFYGIRDEDHGAYRDQFENWKQNFNVNVVEVHSQPKPGWTGKTGYIQAVLKETPISVPRNTGVVVCGVKDMFTDVKEHLLESGVFEGRIRTNF